MSARRGDYPYWAYPSHRRFKATKRAQLRAVLKAPDDLRDGSLYLPYGGYETLMSVSVRAEQLRRLLSAKAWGR